MPNNAFLQKAGPRLSVALEGTDVEILGFIWYGSQSTHASAV